MVAWWWIVWGVSAGLAIGFGLGFKCVISGFYTGLRDKNSPLHYAMQMLELKSMETYAATAEKYDEQSRCPAQCGHKIAAFFREAVKKCQADDKAKHA